jgi:hypothetical protein
MSKYISPHFCARVSEISAVMSESVFLNQLAAVWHFGTIVRVLIFLLRQKNSAGDRTETFLRHCACRGRLCQAFMAVCQSVAALIADVAEKRAIAAKKRPGPAATADKGIKVYTQLAVRLPGT